MLNIRNLIRQFVCLSLSIVLGLSLASCRKDENPFPNEVLPDTSQLLNLELSSEIDPMEVGLSIEKLRSMAFTSNGSKPILDMGKSDWKGHLFFRKVGDNSFVGYAAVTWTASYDAKRRKIVLKSSQNISLENAPALPQVGETWYISAVLGGGTLSGDKQSINFAANGVQESADGISSGLNVPFVSKWTPLSITTSASGVSRKAHFTFSPKGFIMRATIMNKTNYDYRIYRNKSVNGRLSPELPRLIFTTIDAQTDKLNYLGLSLNFSTAKNPEASLRSGTVGSEPITKAVNDRIFLGENMSPIYPDPKNPITLTANGGSCSVLLWNYAVGRDLRILVNSALHANRYQLYVPPSFRREGSTAIYANTRTADIAVNIPASKVADGRSYKASFEMYRRAAMALDFVLSPQQESRLGLPEIDRSGILLTPLEYSENHYRESQVLAISSFVTGGLSYIFPAPQHYTSSSVSGTPVFLQSIPSRPGYSFTTPFTTIDTEKFTLEQVKGMGDGKTIYALRFTPTTVDAYGVYLQNYPSPTLYDGNPGDLPPYHDGEMQAAYRYEYTTYPGSPTRKALKVTARYLGNAWHGSIEDIAKPSFWDTHAERNVVYYFPQNGGYLKNGRQGGAFLGFNQNVRNSSASTKQLYHMSYHAFSEWGIWGEYYHTSSYENRGPVGRGSAILMQPLDKERFGIPHYYHPLENTQFFKDLK